MKKALALILLASVAIACADDKPPSNDPDAGVDLDSDTDSDTDGDTDGDGDTDTETVTDTDTFPEERPPTTLLQTVVGLLPAVDQTGSGSVDRTFWGLTEAGPGEPWMPLDGLGVGESTTVPIGEPSSIAYIWHVTDSQIVDEESPARLINGDFYEESAYRYQESWTTQFLEASVRTANLFSHFRKFDFALLTGDMIDNIHINELDWYVGVMDGDLVHPDSGDDDDPLPGAENDPHDPFLAAGLDADVPWYITAGNHDLLELGNGPLLAWLLADPTGDTTSLLSKAVVPTCLEQPWYADESPVPERCYLPPKTEFTSSSVIPDEDRAYLDIYQWLDGHFGTLSYPDGHGYTQNNLDYVFGSYTVEEAVDGIPVTLISIDMVSESGQWGTFDQPRRDWLEMKLIEAEEARRVVIVMSHHTGHSLDDEVERAAFIEMLHEYPNVIAHIGGHTHLNRITPRPAPDGYGLEHGYWEIETAATMDWPQQTRLVEIVDNRDGTGDIYCTMIDFQIPPDFQVVAGGRFYTLFDVQSGGGYSGIGDPEDRNVILRFQWPEDLADDLALLPYREVESFNFEQ